jgi:uncharacterized GH25 family protein
VTRPSRRAAFLPVLASLALLSFAPFAAAHDFWIEPSTFRPAPGEDFTVSLRVGEHFRGEPVPRDDRRLKRFFVVSTLGESPIPGLPGADPAGFAKLTTPGVAVLGYRSDRSPVILEAEKFQQYLADQGLDAIIRERSKRGDTQKPGREVFSRSAKSIVFAGARGPDFDRRLGLLLEILLQSDPARWSSDAPVKFRVLYDDKPLAASLVKAICREDPDQTLTVRTARDGTASLVLPRKGVWLVETEHMIPAPRGVDADWESIWGSLTFEIP